MFSKEKKDWLTPDNVVEEFGIAKSTQAQYRALGKIPFSKLGRKVLYSRAKLNKWLEDAEVSNNA